MKTILLLINTIFVITCAIYLAFIAQKIDSLSESNILEKKNIKITSTKDKAIMLLKEGNLLK